MYTRHQLEWAIAKLSRVATGAAEVRFRSQIKRLLQLDRSLAVADKDPKSPISRNYAFFGEKGPGTGGMVGYSRHDVFILALAFRTLKLGWKPQFLVPAFRVFRSELCKEFDRLNSPNGKPKFRETDNNLLRESWLSSGMMVNEPSELSWLVLANELQFGLKYKQVSAGALQNSKIANIVHSTEELAQIVANMNVNYGHSIVLDICNPTVSIEYLLDKAPDARRGRPKGT